MISGVWCVRCIYGLVTGCQKFGLCQTHNIKYYTFYPNKLYPDTFNGSTQPIISTQF